MTADPIAANEHRTTHGSNLAPIVAGITVLLGSLANFLSYHNYPFMTYEVGIFAISFASVSAIAGVFYRGQRVWGKVLMEVMLTIIAVDLNTDGLILPMIAALATLIANLVMKKSVLPLLSMIGGIVLVTSLSGLTDSRDWMDEKQGTNHAPSSSAPAILHIILDEHIGIEGLPSNNPATPAMKAFLQEFYVSRGFRLFGRAHSQYFDSVNSVPQILNYGGAAHRNAGPGGTLVRRSNYFDQLQMENYNVHIVQSEWIEMCTAAPYQSCKTYWSPSLQIVGKSSMSVLDRGSLIFFKLLALSDVAEIVGYHYDRATKIYLKHGIDIPALELKRRSHTESVTALYAFDELIGDLKFASPGDAYIAHILLPHYPYVANSRCQLIPLPWEARQTRSSITDRELASFEQIKCATAKVDEAINAIAKSPAGKKVIVIVHGDHGSRITNLDPNVDNVGKFGDSEMLAGFSTIFAIRMPEFSPGLDDRPATAGNLLEWAMSSKQMPRGHSSLPRSDGTVVLADKRTQPRKLTKLPQSWVQSQTAPK